MTVTAVAMPAGVALLTADDTIALLPHAEAWALGLALREVHREQARRRCPSGPCGFCGGPRDAEGRLCHGDRCRVLKRVHSGPVPGTRYGARP